MPDQASPQDVVFQEALFGDVCNVLCFFVVGRKFVVLQKLDDSISKLVPGLQQRQVRGKHINFFQRIATKEVSWHFKPFFVLNDKIIAVHFFLQPVKGFCVHARELF